MSLYSTRDARSVGNGQLSPPGSITDKGLSQMVGSYKTAVASRYRALVPEEVELAIPTGRLWVSPKIDGEQWCLVLDDDGCFLANPNGRVLAGALPVLEEAAACLSRVRGRTVVAGELYAHKESGRTRHGDLAQALGGEAEADVDRIRFAAFDLVSGGDEQAQMPLLAYADRLEVLQRIFPGGERLQVVQTETVDGKEDVSRLYGEWVERADAEGVVARAETGVTFKVKPTVTLDAAVVGYTLRSEDETQVSSFLLAMLREDGHFQLIGHCGNLGNEQERRRLLAQMTPRVVESDYREASSRGALYRFVRPEVVVEIRVSDVQAEKADGDVVPRMVLAYENERWRTLRVMPGVSLLHPRLARIRDDKKVRPADIPIAQVMDRVLLPDAGSAAAAVELPPSELVRREVYTKESNGKTAVRKLVVWKTNKEEIAGDFPAFVVHWTDYSPGRKDPLKRTVRLAPTQELATEIADQMVAGEIKRGWERQS